jgi:hypothetical protein
MMNRDPERERPRSREEIANLTLIQLGTWPLLVVLSMAPALPLAATPMPWYLARLFPPLAAAGLALLYLWQRPESAAGVRTDPPMPGGAISPLRQQAAFLLPGLAIALMLARLLTGPVEPVTKVLLFGLADVAATQLIHFGVVRRSWPDEDAGNIAAVALFAASWGIRETIDAALTPAPESLGLVFAAGAVIGLALGGLSLLLRRWPGGWLPAASAQLILATLVFGLT